MGNAAYNPYSALPLPYFQHNIICTYLQLIKPDVFSCVLFFQSLLEEMTLEELRQLTSELLQRQPGLIFDALRMHQCRHDVPFAEC